MGIFFGFHVDDLEGKRLKEVQIEKCYVSESLVFSYLLPMSTILVEYRHPFLLRN